MALPTTITGISTIAACVGPFKSTNAPLFVNEGTTSGAFGQQAGNTAANTLLGQTFTAPSSNSITSIVLPLNKINSPTDNYFVDIYATSAGLPTGAALASSNAVAATSLTSGTRVGVEFTFATPYALVASTVYAIVLRRSGAVDASNYAQWGNNSSDLITGQGCTYNGSSWTGFGTNDLHFTLKSNIEAYYFIGIESAGTNSLLTKKATDPTSSFSSVGGAATFSAGVKAIAAYQVGDVIHVAAHNQILTTTQEVLYFTFDMSSDAWIVNGETIQTGHDGRTSGLVQQFGVSIVVRPSDSQVIVAYNGARAAVMGSSYSRIVAKRRTGVATWVAADGVTSPTPLDAGGSVDHIRPEVVLGVSSSVHFLWQPGTAATGIAQRTLNSSNALQTASTTNTTVTDGPDQAISYDSAGTTKVVVAGQGTGEYGLYFDSANTPTLNNSSAFGTGVGGQIGRTFNDGTDVWLVYMETASQDLFVRKSTDHGATFGAASTLFTGTVTAGAGAGLSRDGNIYLRGSDYVIPYVVNDAGTLKYNEYVVRSIASTKAFPPFKAPRKIWTRRFH